MAHPIFCDVCNIGVSSEVTMRDHMKGRRHQQTLCAMERKKAMARNSLYCHGFAPSTPTDELRTYFQRFGAVTRIMVETHKGCYCIVQYDTEAPVQKALTQRSHQLFGCSLTVRPRRPITTQRRPPEAERKQGKTKAAKEEEDLVEASHEQLMSSLLQADSVLGQMEVLYESMRLSEADLERRKSVCDYLYSILFPFVPTCSIHQFGSSVNGFGMRGCDMDIFLDLHDTDVSLQREETLRHKLKSVNLPLIREIQSLKTTEGPLMPSQLRQLSLVHRVKLMSRIIMRHATNCVNVLFVPSVRCPIVRFVHLPTGIKCDLSINNSNSVSRLALRNTQLLKMCAEDHRVRLLMFAVRYWGKWKQVAGNQNCGPRLSNYCLSLLVLFYLANTSPPVLPSVQALADLTDPEQKCIIEQWDCSLPEAAPPTTNTQPADELLHQFFKFYQQVSLSTSVILTRPGTVMSLNDFLLEKVNTPHLNDFKVKALAVQDPFVLQHNIAQNLNNQVRDLLVQEIGYATTKTATWSSPDSTSDAQPSQSTDSQTSQALWGLPYLFSSQDCVSPEPQTPSPSSSSSSWCEPVNIVTTKKSKQWTLSLSLDLSLLSQQVLKTLQAKGDYRAVWFRRVRTLFIWALREVFLFAVKTDKEGSELAEQDLDRVEEEQQEDVEQMCVEDEGGGDGENSPEQCGKCRTEDLCVGHSSVEDDSVSLPNVEDSDHKSSAAQEVVMTDGCLAEGPSLSADVGPGDARRVLEGEGSGFASTAGAGSAGEDGVMQSPRSEHSSSMHSPSEASPMAMFGAEQNMQDTSECCDVEMTVDSVAAHPAPSEVDSSTAPGDRRDLPCACAIGEAATASGVSVLPLRVEINPVGEGKVYVSAKDDLSSCSSSEAATQDSSLLNAEGSSVQTSSDKPSINACSSQHKIKKCKALRIYCEGKYKAWYGRKATRTNLLAEGHADGLELEKLISKQIAERDADSKMPPLKFYCTLSPIAKGDRPEAEVNFEPAESLPKEFSVFNTFFKSYFSKLVSKNLLESPTV